MSLNVAWGDEDSDDGTVTDILADDGRDDDSSDAIGSDDSDDDLDAMVLASVSIRDMQAMYMSNVRASDEYRSIDTSHNILCRFMNEHSRGIAITTGHVGNTRYVVPLHVPPVVIGHSHMRIAVHDSGTTKLGMKVSVVSRINVDTRMYINSGSMGLCDAIALVHSRMSINDINPEGFSTHVEMYDNDTSHIDSPITVGYSAFSDQLLNARLSLVHDKKLYTVPTGCPSTRYRTPAGLGSTMVVNSVVLTYPNVNQYLIDATCRCPTSEDRGFLCTCSGSPSAALKGLVRYCVTGTVCRCYNSGVGAQLVALQEMLSGNACRCVGSDRYVKYVIAGCVFQLCGNCHDIISGFVMDCCRWTPHCLTLHHHTYRNVPCYVLSFCTGAIMRFAEPYGWIDSKSVQGKYTDYRTVTAPALSLIPHMQYINPIRAALLNIYIAQAICSPCCRYHPGMILIPQYRQSLIASDCHADIGVVDTRDHVPGLNLFCVFMNMELTYEDGMVLSRSAARRFEYVANISVYLDPTRDTIPARQSHIAPYSIRWWQNHFGGTVSAIESSTNGMVKVVISCTCLPVNGDKFTTLHGQKGVVTILDDYSMPHIDGRPADIVIGSSSIIKRQTISQLLEASYNMHAVTHMSDVYCPTYDAIAQHYATSYNLHQMDINHILCKYAKSVEIAGSTVRRSTSTMQSGIKYVSDVVANYGMIRVMQSSFLASFRQSSTYRCCHQSRARPDTSSSGGGSRSLGEMEIMQMLGSGMVHTLSEFALESDIVVVDVCRMCRCLTMLCECADHQTGTDKIRLPYRSVKFAITLYVSHGLRMSLW